MNIKERYLELVKKSLMDTLQTEITGFYLQPVELHDYRPWHKKIYMEPMIRFLTKCRVVIHRMIPVESSNSQAMSTSSRSLSLIGKAGLTNIEECVKAICEENISGDLIETGVWRGGASIFMAAALEAYDDRERQLWVADSFCGLPKPDIENYSVDEGDIGHLLGYLKVDIDRVKHHFKCFDLMSDRIHFLKGWFKDTLPSAPFEKLSLMRLDGDMYESTMDALVNLYPKLSSGGYVIIDDYELSRCKAAVDEYREAHQINEPLIWVNNTIVYWKRK